MIIRSRVSVVAHFARLVWCPTHPCIFCDSGCPSRRGNNQTLTRRSAAVYGETFTISAYLLRNKTALVKRPSAFYVLIEKFSRVWATTFTDLISYRWLLISTSGPQGILLIAGLAQRTALNIIFTTRNFTHFDIAYDKIKQWAKLWIVSSPSSVLNHGVSRSSGMQKQISVGGCTYFTI